MGKKRVYNVDSPTDEVMYIIEANCWKCHQPMKVAIIRGDFDKREATTCGPEKFSEEEKAIAASKGVFIKDSYSNTMNEGYAANVCQHCGGFVGQHFLFTDYFTPAQMGDYSYETIKLT